MTAPRKPTAALLAISTLLVAVVALAGLRPAVQLAGIEGEDDIPQLAWAGIEDEDDIPSAS